MNEGKLVALGVDSPKKAMSISSLWRTCYCFGVDFIFSMGIPIEEVDSLETFVYVPKRVVDSIEFRHYHTFADVQEAAQKLDAKIVGVEWPIVQGGYFELPYFKHPDRAIYLFGSEFAKGTDQAWWTSQCDEVVMIPTVRCLATASVGAMVLYDRYYKEWQNDKQARPKQVKGNRN